ncbi:MAG TPA: RluA family pseudouridine synthase [Verrucomicrobiae bacterium]|nr:RluA family pseudouridine synthase [Verrucomicrobiae bacterium]
MLKFIAEEKERLDKFIASKAQVSRGKVQKAIKDGLISVSGKIVSETDHPLKPGDEVELPEFKEYELVPSNIELKVVYQNEDLLVIDKPAGLVVHPGAGKTENTLSHALISKYPAIKNVGEKFRPGIVHRLDEDTSGLILVAKTSSAYDYLKELFLNHKVEKKYLALVHGVPEKLHGIIDVPLEKNFKRQKMKVGSGKEAITEYSVVSEGAGSGLDRVTLLRVNLHTGRTHQIRAHLAHINHPIVGDQVYGGIYKKTDEQILNRQFLHAYYLKFPLSDGTVVELTSNLPEELVKILEKVNIKYDPII